VDYGKRDLLNLSGKSATRTEQTVNAYYRIHKFRLQKEIEADFALNGGTDTKLAHRNRFLASKFKKEPDDVREHVRNSRIKANERKKQDIKWDDDEDISVEERLRRENAMEYSS
jgi:hypothetical protein